MVRVNDLFSSYTIIESDFVTKRISSLYSESGMLYFSWSKINEITFPESS